MSTVVTDSYALALSEEEHAVLVNILEDAFKTIQIEEHRTDALHAKEVIRARKGTIESLLRKARTAKST